MHRLSRRLLVSGLISIWCSALAGPSTYQLFLGGETVADANERVEKAGGSAQAKASAGKVRLAEIARQHAKIEEALGSGKIRVAGKTANLANSVLVVAEDGDVDTLTTLPGVVSVEKVIPLERHTITSVPFLGAPQVWLPTAGGLTGRGIRIAIVDSGIDYTHATFGGAGTSAAYAANNPNVIEPGSFPTSKVIGGRDFAGDNYDAGGTGGSPVPSPDPDPLDPQANGHGSHVAGIAAGFGVLTNATAFAGPFGTNIYTNSFRVGPGVAPEALLYAFKVFGSRGTTALVPLALDAAADPNGDGDTGDRADVVNLSLGSGFGTEAETSQTSSINRLASLGSVVVISAGNSGNTHYIIGTPGTSARAITVANSYDDGSTSSTISVTAPDELIGEYAAVEGSFTFPIANAGRIAARVVQTEPTDACLDGDNGLITNPSEIANNIALIDRGTCYFVNKVRAAQEAGALAVVVVNNVDGFPIPMAGTGDTTDIRIPGVMISRTDGVILKRRLADGVFVTIEPRSATVRPELADQLNDSSSRGPVAYNSRLKPDIAAPGSAIPSARAGFGSEPILQTGTSMSAPHVAGAAAILKQARPNWTPAEIKAVLMNTAVRTADADGIAYPESRVGAGRLNIPAAVATTVIARNAASPDEVSLSFGAMELSARHTEERQIRVLNKGTSALTLNISVSNTFGARVATLIPSTNSVKLSAGQERIVSFTFRADPVSVEDDPTTPDSQGDRLRPKMPEASGQVWFKAGSIAIHVPWHAIVRPVAMANAGATNIGLSAGSVSIVPVPTIRNAASGEGLVGVFQYGGSSTDRGFGFPGGSGDLVAFGAATDFAEGGDPASARVFFGLATAAKWVTPQRYFGVLDVEVDTNADGVADFLVANSNGGNINGNDLDNDQLATDFLLSAVRRSGGGELVEGGVLNVLDPKAFDTALFQNAVLVHSVPASAIGLSAGNTAFRYRAKTSSSATQDTSSWATFDLAAPQVSGAGLGIAGSPWQREGQGVRVRVTRGAGQPEALLLHLHNPTGSQVERIRFNTTTSDVDGNTLADAEELLYFPRLGSPATGDADGDGMENGQELRAGTDPTDRNSVFRVTASLVTPGVPGDATRNFSWRSVSGHRYSVLRSATLSGPYAPVATGIEATPDTNTFADPNPPAESAFYKIVIE